MEGLPEREHPRRSRALYAALIAITIALGLASRRYASSLPWWLAKNAGDGLYATMVYFGFAFLRPRARTLHVAVAATGFCFAIEFSQIYQAAWINAVRDTRLGGLILGHGFHALDLVCYVVGVGLAVGIETAARAVNRSRSTST